MLTGNPAFNGETTTDILAAVVTKESDLTGVPVKVRRLIESCLKKDPKHRLQAIGDWRLLVEDLEPPAVSPRSRTPWIAAAAVLAIIVVAALAGWWRATRPVEHPLMRLSVDLGPGALARPQSHGHHFARWPAAGLCGARP